MNALNTRLKAQFKSGEWDKEWSHIDRRLRNSQRPITIHWLNVVTDYSGQYQHFLGRNIDYCTQYLRANLLNGWASVHGDHSEHGSYRKCAENFRHELEEMQRVKIDGRLKLEDFFSIRSYSNRSGFGLCEGEPWRWGEEYPMTLPNMLLVKTEIDQQLEAIKDEIWPRVTQFVQVVRIDADFNHEVHVKNGAEASRLAPEWKRVTLQRHKDVADFCIKDMRHLAEEVVAYCGGYYQSLLTAKILCEDKIHQLQDPEFRDLRGKQEYGSRFRWANDTAWKLMRGHGQASPAALVWT